MKYFARKMAESGVTRLGKLGRVIEEYGLDGLAADLERLCVTDRLGLGRFDVFLDLRVRCTDCGNAYGLADLLEANGCECGCELPEG